MSAQRKLAELESGSAFVDELRELAHLIHKASGIQITEERLFLVETRLSGRINELGLTTFGDYNRLLARDLGEVQYCIELMTTHKTEWFREIQHFAWLKGQIECGKLRPQKERLNIWSAACSSGQEVYSLAFLLIKMGLTHNQFRILGSDISRPVLDTAEHLHESLEFMEQRRKLLLRVPDGERTNLEIDSAIQNSIKFRQFNLIEDELFQRVQFDVIFLRNVLIYFDKPTTSSVCKKLGRKLKPGGFLILGMTESMGDHFDDFKLIGTSIYQLKRGTP